MRTRTVVGWGLLTAAIGIGLLIAGALTGWRPRFGLEADFQQVIRAADVEDRYRGAEAGGWDSADVTDQVCGRIDLATLQSMGANQRFYVLLGDEVVPPRKAFGWKMTEDIGLMEACRTHSQRYLDIEIDAETFVCTARVSVLPTCDL